MTYFKSLSPEQRKRMLEKSTNTRRSPALRKAWANQELLKAEHQPPQELSIQKIADKWGIGLRATNRIINGT